MTPDAISIDSDGNLQNGQHRLMAIVNTGIAAPCFIVTGMPPEAFWAEGTGAPKKASDALHIAGETNAKNLASAAKILVIFDTNGKIDPSSVGAKSDAEMMKRSIEKHPSVRGFVNAASNGECKRAVGFLMAYCGVMALASEKYGADKVMDFYEKYRRGTMLDADDPAYVLRERMVEMTARNSISPRHRIAMFAKALSAHCNNKKMKLLRWRDAEDFPSI